MAKIISRRAVTNNPEKIVRVLNLRDFYNKRNKILICRSVGGLGDIFMHRMMFEDIKKTLPDAEIHFACPAQYHDALIDHPYIDKILDSETVDKMEYIISYNTTTACGRYEMKMAPLSDLNRSDIWSRHCGIVLENHNMHIRLTDDEKAFGKKKIEQMRDRDGPIVLVCPISAMVNKNLLDHQLIGLIDGLYMRGCCALGLHYSPIGPLVKRNVPCIHSLGIRQWMGVLHAADYIVSVDTSALHCAGGMGKPLTGIFTWADGKAYGKHYDFVLVQRHRDNDPSWTCGPCYNWCGCPKEKKSNLKPCLTELTTEMILRGVDEMFQRWPDERVKNHVFVTNIG